MGTSNLFKVTYLCLQIQPYQNVPALSSMAYSKQITVGPSRLWVRFPSRSDAEPFCNRKVSSVFLNIQKTQTQLEHFCLWPEHSERQGRLFSYRPTNSRLTSFPFALHVMCCVSVECATLLLSPGSLLPLKEHARHAEMIPSPLLQCCVAHKQNGQRHLSKSNPKRITYVLP